MNPWVGYEANAAVIAEVAESELGCAVTKKDLKEEVAWQGFGTGEVDAVVENWAHEDLKQKYVEEQKTAVEAGPTGGKGVIGWWVPPWMAEEYPDITDWQNLDKYASLFETSESGGKGQLLDGDPSFVTNDEALVKNLELDYEVVYAGSEAALITAFRKAEADRTPLLGYFYDPQWFQSEVPLVKVELPEHTEGCDADAEKVACDYPVYELDKIVSKEFADSGSPAAELIKNFTWTNDDQNIVAKYIAEDKMSPGGRGEEVGRRQPRQGRGVAALTAVLPERLDGTLLLGGTWTVGLVGHDRRRRQPVRPERRGEGRPRRRGRRRPRRRRGPRGLRHRALAADADGRARRPARTAWPTCCCATGRPSPAPRRSTPARRSRRAGSTSTTSSASSATTRRWPRPTPAGSSTSAVRTSSAGSCASRSGSAR